MCKSLPFQTLNIMQHVFFPKITIVKQKGKKKKKNFKPEFDAKSPSHILIKCIICL